MLGYSSTQVTATEYAGDSKYAGVKKDSDG
jgi:hypothetical protein